jgi:Citrate lyase, alpha subunit
MITRLSRSILFATAVVLAFACAAPAQDIKVNEAPLRDFAKDVQAKIDKKEIDVTKPFAVEMSAVIKDDGKLDKNASKFTSESGDPKMVEVAKQAIWAMGDSGYFGYLQQAGISQATLSVTQTAQTFTGSVHSSKNRFEAAIVTSGINAALKIGLSQDMQPNEKLILQNTRASHDGGNIDITCTLPAADFQRMILGNKSAVAGPSQ